MFCSSSDSSLTLVMLSGVEAAVLDSAGDSAVSVTAGVIETEFD